MASIGNGNELMAAVEQVACPAIARALVSALLSKGA